MYLLCMTWCLCCASCPSAVVPTRIFQELSCCSAPFATSCMRNAIHFNIMHLCNVIHLQPHACAKPYISTSCTSATSYMHQVNKEATHFVYSTQPDAIYNKVAAIFDYSLTKVQV